MLVLYAFKIELWIKPVGIVRAMHLTMKNLMDNAVHALTSVSHAYPLITVLSVFQN